MCPVPATTREHAPPQSFFPEGFRTNLLTVPSCAAHNNANSDDVEYVRNIICTQRGTNEVADLVIETVKRSYDYNGVLFDRTFYDRRFVTVGGEKTVAFSINLQRHRQIMRAISYALYYRDMGKRHDGGFGIFSPSMLHKNQLYHGRPDPAEGLRRLLESGTFTSMPVSEPRVFKYGILDPGEGQVLYRFEFYESYIVNAWTRPFDPSPNLYLPIGGRWVCRQD